MNESPDYVYIVFDNTRDVAADDESYRGHLARITSAPPMFFCIDDDMTEPTADELTFHGQWVRKLMGALAPTAAPWELDGGNA